MSQTPSDKFLYFTIGLLKGSATLDALREDATKHHMIDHPGQLIALRLTEYYEMVNQGTIKPSARVPSSAKSPETETTASHEKTSTAEMHAPQRPVPITFPSPAAPHSNIQPQPAPVPIHAHVPSTSNNEPTSALNQLTGKMRAVRREGENIVTVSSAADQNADDAADYWSTL